MSSHGFLEPLFWRLQYSQGFCRWTCHEYPGAWAVIWHQTDWFPHSIMVDLFITWCNLEIPSIILSYNICNLLYFSREIECSKLACQWHGRLACHVAYHQHANGMPNGMPNTWIVKKLVFWHATWHANGMPKHLFLWLCNYLACHWHANWHTIGMLACQ